MADKKITELNLLAAASLATSDALPIVDVSVSQTKKTTIGDLDTRFLARANHTGTQLSSTIAGTATKIPYFDGSGLLQSTPGLALDGTSGGLSAYNTYQPNAAGGLSVHQTYVGFDPLQDSPTDYYSVFAPRVEFDYLNNGFDQGTAGESVAMCAPHFSHQGKGDIGGFSFHKQSFEIGNGTDPITVRGAAYSYGFGSFHDGVTLNGPLQGYGFQPSATSGVTFTSNAYTNAFYDFANVQTAVAGWRSFTSGPSIASIQNNTNYVGFDNNPIIPLFSGNAGYIGLGLSGNFGTFGTGIYQAVVINPTVSSVANANGIFVDMSNVNASGSKYAINAIGDVAISGGLSFTGGLSIGQLQAYFAANPINGGGTPSISHGLTSQITALNGVTTANCDGIATATTLLLELQANSINTSGPFGLGFTGGASSLVVESHTGSTVDFVNASLSALNLMGTSTGGTIGRVNLSRTVAVPNGITTVNELVHYFADTLFGDVGTDSWGFYASSANMNNYFRNHVKIGSGSNKVSAGQALEVIGTSQLNGNIGFFGTTPAAQQTGGVATAGGTYGATEQTMLQKVYDALRTYGLLT